MKIAMIDNFDSFTFNLVQYFEEQSGVDLTVFKNNEPVHSILNHFDKLVISPGPGIPSESGNIIDIIRQYSGKKPILGVCLGLQAIYEAFGGQLMNLNRVFHGVTSQVHMVEEDPMLAHLPNPFYAGRYHSWVCDPQYLPEELIITAWDTDNEIMACRHRTHSTFGVQFHPESFLTLQGKQIIKNFVRF